ncbi:MAG: methyl-accepting chemotaxis protein [Mucispirillum sp.]|nr:methyl-accepting chemotaxis protein [Mucispirillum sp.]
MKITLKVKIFAIIILLITMALIIGLFAFLSMKNAANTTEDMSQKYMHVYTLNTTIGLNSMDFRRFFYIIQRTPNNANLEIITNMGNKTTSAMSQMHTFMQNETNKNLMPEVAAIVPEFNTAVNTYISTAVNQLTLRVQNAPKEDEFLKNIDNFIKESDNFRDTVRKMINNAETPEEAIRYFRNYDRISDISIDMGTVKDDFSNAVALNSLKELLHIEALLKNIYNNLNNIRDNLNNRNLINNVTAMINSSEKLIQNYNHLKDVYTKMQNIAVSRTASLKTMEEMIEKVRVVVNTMTKESSESSINTILRANIVIFVLLILMIITAVFSLITVQKTVLAPINMFVKTAKNLTSGDKDLTIRLTTKTKDELAELALYFNTFIENVQTIVKEVKEAAQDVASGNNQLAATMEEFSATFSSQAEQVDNIVVDMNVIKNNSEEATNEMSQNLNKIDETTQRTIEGQHKLNNIKNTMLEISDNTKQLSKIIDNLLESSTQIGEILTVINDIADQTNLLALNAAIEAARAGDAGRGFAVVADEVRKLAERTTKATSEIENIISSLQHESEQAAVAMKSADTSVSTGVDVIEETASSFTYVVDGVNDVTNSTHSMMTNFEEQYHTIQDVTDKTQAIASGIEESNVAVSEVTVTVDHLQERTEKLKTLVEQFKS